MKVPNGTGLVACVLMLTVGFPSRGQDPEALLPPGVRAVWDPDQAFHETTRTRERICINGLWRWQPAQAATETDPARPWGFAKVPGCWPGLTDYMQKDSQTIHAAVAWKEERLGKVTAAWYERTVTVPRDWTGRRVALTVEYLNSYAAVYIDGTRRGELRFPGGELDLTPFVRPGATHALRLLVVAMPLKGVLLSFTDSNAAREVAGRVERRGLCGDVFLVSKPLGPRVERVRVDTSVRRSEIAIGVDLADLGGGADSTFYSLRAQIRTRAGRAEFEFKSRLFRAGDLAEGRFSFTNAWNSGASWDLDTATNQFEAWVSLQRDPDELLDAHYGTRFGFREFWIDGRDFYFNGSRLYLCAVPLDNAQVGAAQVTYEAARESLERLKAIGINLVYTHNYGCEPGAHLGFEDILRAADDVGMLVSLSQPHFSHYDWRTPEADQTNGYAGHAQFYAQVAGSHPSVVAYAMSHNATGYEEDMNPHLIDGVHEPRDRWSANNARLALRAETLVKRLDPVRIVYHHASGNLGSMHAINFYPNFAPVQELSDWFEHWATTGVKPVFTCEYGAPFTWDWTMYRGWYRGERNFGSAQVPWEYCMAEWNAQFLGDRAYQISVAEAANLRWEARQFRAGKVWHRWDYPHAVGSPVFDEQYPIIARYLSDNWRAFRTWGVSAISPWEYEHYWKLRPGVEKRRRELAVDWDRLQRPGFSPDYLDQQYERMDLAFERSDWVPTEAALALRRNNGSMLAYLGGPAAHFTSKEHVYLPGQPIEKQLIVINNSRRLVNGEGEWTLEIPQPSTVRRSFSLAAGQQERLPVRFTLPDTLQPGRYALTAQVRFANGETQEDSFRIHVVSRPPSVDRVGRIGVFDPKGETAEMLGRMGIRFQRVETNSDLTGMEMLIVGRAALTVSNAAPDISRVRDGLKVLLFEQSSATLEKRFGFRVAEYGLREVFPRVPDHPVLAGLGPEHWRDWRGEATLLSPQLEYTLRPRFGPTVNWCDLPVPRLWRCGNRGNVASVLIEKPACGDFLPVLDGGFGLQYSPLLEYREGRGLVIFCQLDVTARTEEEPVAETVTRNLLRYLKEWKPVPTRAAFYVGEEAGRRHLESAGFEIGPDAAGKLRSDQLLVIDPRGARELASRKVEVAEFLKAGGRLFAIGFDQGDAELVLPQAVRLKRREHISSFVEAAGMSSTFSGIGSADVHNRDPGGLALVESGAVKWGDGVFGETADRSIVFCGWVPWQFDRDKSMNLKRTFRRASFALTRLLANGKARTTAPILARFQSPLEPGRPEKRWLSGMYLDQPEEWDDPYRFFRW